MHIRGALCAGLTVISHDVIHTLMAPGEKVSYVRLRNVGVDPSCSCAQGCLREALHRTESVVRIAPNLRESPEKASPNGGRWQSERRTCYHGP
jgi:hypothetical protein